MKTVKRNHKGFISGALIGTLGGLIGLGGAEFRLPVLVGIFRLETLKAIILNKAMSLVVVFTALIFRIKTISIEQLSMHYEVPLNLLAGSLIGAWIAAGYAIKIDCTWLNRIILVLLTCLSLLMLSEAFFGIHGNNIPLFQNIILRILTGLIAGFLIGIFAALLGVAGGELLIPTIVLLYGVDIKIAGSLSLIVSLPTMLVSFARYTRSDAFSVLKNEKSLLKWMIIGSIMGSAIGGLLIGFIPTKILMIFLGLILLVSAIKTFKHSA
jgi:uncharacterized protein